MSQTLFLLIVVASLLLCCLLVGRVALAARHAPAGHFFSGGGQGRRAHARHAKAGPTDPSKAGLSGYPDRPLDKTPRAPVTPRFVVEHRTALGGKDVTVRGCVVAVAPVPAGSALPRIFVAETCEPGRNKSYDLMVLLSEDDDAYALGDEVEVRGTVESSKVAVHLRKSYGGARP